MAVMALALGVLSARPVRAEVRLPKVFASHMVLQRDLPLNVWGWGQPGETVTVRIASASVQAKANDRGEWKTTLPAMKAGGPHTLTVSGSSTVTFEDVLVGEVWVCSGQSNMEMGVGVSRDAATEIAAANYPQIRLLMVPNRWTPEPQKDMDGVWKVCTPKAIAADGWGGFSAAGYYFGRELHKKLGVPVGLIDATWGGTVIQTWTPPEGFAAVPALKGDYERVRLTDPKSEQHAARLAQVLQDTEKWLAEARKAATNRSLVPTMPVFPEELRPPHDVQNATALFNGMIRPICPFTIRGALWYQGEANVAEGKLYTERMKALIGGWRQLWGEGDFPFYFVQIAPFNYGGRPQTLAEFWEAQAAAAQVIPNSGMAVINDIGDLADIHPTNKQDVGKRLALLALANAYGQKGVLAQGPTFKSMTTEGSKLRLTFDNVGTGLASRDNKPLSWFEIADAEQGGFVKANAQIDGASVVLSAPEVKRPVAVRYAWSMLAEPNLRNADGLPAPAFRAGEIPRRDSLARVPEAKDYQLVYDLDLAKLGPSFTYDIDNRSKINGPFDRIAYSLELQSDSGETQWVYVSMDAFTNDLGKIGIPTVASGARFQQNVTNLNVYSNVKSLVTGQGIRTGNIEFWPNNYGQNNTAMVPNASSTLYDFGDDRGAPDDGYGSMQVHNHEAKQTLFAVNNWKAGAGADLGIGNRSDTPNTNPDWTFSGNARTYTVKRLRVLVHRKQ
jgi:sialate O-acetylesterase